MMNRINMILLLLATAFILSSCGEGYGSMLGIPGFILDPIYYANTEVDRDVIDLGIKDVYAVVYTDAAGVPLDHSLWVYFVPDDYNLQNILAGTIHSYVVMTVNDVTQVTAGTEYTIDHALANSNYMVWMDINDGGAVYTGDTIEIGFDRISSTEGASVKGDFTSTLHRGSSIALAEKFKFEAEINYAVGTPML
jgi:hypothetical protein